MATGKRWIFEPGIFGLEQVKSEDIDVTFTRTADPTELLMPWETLPEDESAPEEPRVPLEQRDLKRRLLKKKRKGDPKEKKDPRLNALERLRKSNLSIRYRSHEYDEETFSLTATEVVENRKDEGDRSDQFVADYILYANPETMEVSGVDFDIGGGSRTDADRNEARYIKSRVTPAVLQQAYSQRKQSEPKEE